MNTYNKQQWVDIVALKSIFQMIQGWAFWEFLGGPVMVGLCASISGGTGPIRVWRTKIPQVMHCCQEIRGWIFLSLTYFAVKKCFSSVQFSRSVMSNSLQPHEPLHARPPCPSPTPGVYPNPCPSSWWCHPNILSSDIAFSSCPQSFLASGSFPMSQLFVSGG